MLAVKRPRSHSQSPNKTDTANVCVTCKEPVHNGDEIFECVWCESMQHRTCLQISAPQFTAMADVSNNILFFCSQCLYKLPNALIAYNKVTKACSTVEKSINTTLSNKFDNLTDQVNKLSSKISEIQQEINRETTSNSDPCDPGLSVTAGNAPHFKFDFA